MPRLHDLFKISDKTLRKDNSYERVVELIQSQKNSNAFSDKFLWYIFFYNSADYSYGQTQELAELILSKIDVSKKVNNLDTLIDILQDYVNNKEKFYQYAPIVAQAKNLRDTNHIKQYNGNLAARFEPNSEDNYNLAELIFNNLGGKVDKLSIPFVGFLNPEKLAAVIIDAGPKKSKDIFDNSEIPAETWMEMSKIILAHQDAEKYIANGFLFSAPSNVFDKPEYDALLKKHVIENKKCKYSDKEAAILYKYQGIKRLNGLEYLAKVGSKKEVSKTLERYVENSFDYDANEIKDFKDHPVLLDYISKKYKIKDKENLADFINRFKGASVEFLKHDNIINLLNLDRRNFQKVMNLFTPDKNTLNSQVVNTVVNSLLQRRFRQESEADCRIFNTFEALLQERNMESVEKASQLLDKMKKTINFADVIGEDNIDLKALFAGDKETLNNLHKLTNAYIARKREIYLDIKYDQVVSELNIPKYYTEAYIKDEFFKQNTYEYIIDNLLRSTRRIDYSDEEKALLNQNNEILDKIIRYKQSPKGAPSPEIRPYMTMFNGILKKMWQERLLKIETGMSRFAPTTPIFEDVPDDFIMSILVNLDFKHLKASLLENPERYDKLCSYLEKYKLAGWNNAFEQFDDVCDAAMDSSKLVSLINYFDIIDDAMLKLNNTSLPVLIDFVTAYSYRSNKFPILLEQENYDLIMSDPGRNQSGELKSERILKSVELVKKMYQREYITIPGGEISCETNGKKITASIGDVYDPIALTYGERTDACMRIGGAGETLFNHCLLDKDGFHVRFEDPETGEFVSRISGFRRGNTIFLNQLRESVSKKYSSEELPAYLRMVAKYLVEATKDDPHPIENVICSSDMAMSGEETVILEYPKGKAPFGNVYSDIHDEGVVLYTASEDHETLKPFKFEEKYETKYKPYNKKAKKVSGKKAQMAVNRIYVLDKLLHGESMEDIELMDADNIVGCIYGHGWAVYLDDNKKIHEIVIDKFKKNPDVLRLVEMSKETIREKIEKKEIVVKKERTNVKIA